MIHFLLDRSRDRKYSHIDQVTILIIKTISNYNLAMKP